MIFHIRVGYLGLICVCSRKNELEWIHVVNKRIDLVDKEERH